MTWTINGVDPRTTYGLVVNALSGWQDDVPEKFPSIAVPGTQGVVRTALTTIIDPRKLVATGTVIGVGSSQANRIADARTKLDGLRALFAKPSLAVVMNDRSTQTLTCDCEGIVVDAGSAQMVAERIGVTISLLAIDPYYYDTTAQNISIAGSSASPGVALPQGTAPARPVITATMGVAGTYETVLLVFDSGGAQIGSIGVTATFALNDTLVVDCAARLVKLNGATRLDLLSSGDFFALDPIANGNYATSAWPAMARGTNMNACTVAYKKAWR